MQAFDYLIVGGGSAGCVLANRLSADARYRVCLIEAGPRDSSPFIAMPGGIIPLLRGSTHNWNFRTAEQRHCGQRRMNWPRGRTLGGSSAINAMCYIRGHRADYEHWAELGNAGWGYDQVLPYFRMAEHFEPGEDAFHGTGGPLNVAELRSVNPLTRAFVEAAGQAGHRPNKDFNGEHQDGAGLYHVMQKGGRRCSNARAYLHDIMDRPNLTVMTDTDAVRVLFEGKRAVGVRVRAGKSYRELRAAREVILAAGAIGSPHLLLLSGVGPSAELAPHAIEVVHDLPGVGKNLQDHLDVHVTVREKTRHGSTLRPSGLWRGIKALFQYLFQRRGELTSNVAEGAAFLRSSANQSRPDLQMHFLPIPNTRHGSDLRPLFKHYAYSLLTCHLRPKSRGEIRLNSADAADPPLIDANYLAVESDLDALVAGLREARRVLEQTAFDAHRDIELEPGADLQSDEDLRQWVRDNAETLYHPVGSCKMGHDAMAVVDQRLRVHGLDGIRVVDAAIMPVLVSGNTNAPTTMIAEKGAAMILQDARDAGYEGTEKSNSGPVEAAA